VPPPAGTVDARSRIEAESYTSSNGLVVRGPTNIGSLDTGEWVKYGPVDFGTGGITKFIARLAVSDTAAGKTMEVRVGSPTGTLIGSLRTTTTGGWSTYADQTATLTAAVTGVQDVYLVFKGLAVAVLDSFTFA
jgi:hypothetical protein